VGYSQNDSHDFYYDDPVGLKSDTTRRKPSPIFAIIALVIGGGFFLQTTLAANISLSSNSSVEFGQGTLKTTSCSGNTQLTLTPNSAFANVAGAGTYKFSSVTVSGIPDSCWGKDFAISAYDESSNTPLALFNTTSTSAVIYNNSGTFELGAGSTGMSVTSGSGTFTATFTAPVALSSSVFRITIQSGEHTLDASNTSYVVGDRGPGGGEIFYVAATPFACGPTRATICTYLEAAPSGWNTGADPRRSWAQPTPVDYQSAEISNGTSPETATATAIGWGYRNTRAIILQGNTATATSAAALADSYTVTVSGVLYDDWYLPSKDELNQMCKWVRGVAWTSNATVCTGGTINTGLGATGFQDDNYWSSSERTAFDSWRQFFYDGSQPGAGKDAGFLVRPVRAF
jgi:hypothetical protein